MDNSKNSPYWTARKMALLLLISPVCCYALVIALFLTGVAPSIYYSALSLGNLRIPLYLIIIIINLSLLFFVYKTTKIRNRRYKIYIIICIAWVSISLLVSMYLCDALKGAFAWKSSFAPAEQLL